jgi:hypothetical protein
VVYHNSGIAAHNAIYNSAASVAWRVMIISGIIPQKAGGTDSDIEKERPLIVSSLLAHD